MPMNSPFVNDMWKLFFNNTDIANMGDAAGVQNSAANGNLYVSLHTANPDGGNQSTSETAYTNYVRVAVPRTTGGWTVSTNTVTNAAEIAFAACGASGATITHFGIGLESSGATRLLASGTCSLVVSTGITPKFAAGELDGSGT